MAGEANGNDSKREEKSDTFSRLWHQRARDASGEKRRALLSLSSGGVATFFFALTTGGKSELTLLQKVAVTGGAGFFGIAVICGVLIWHAEVKRSYALAKTYDANLKAAKKELYRRYNHWTAIRKSIILTQEICFTLGIIAAVVFTIAKAWSY